LDNIRAIVVSVDGKIKLEHYRHRFNADSHEHVWSVTKSVVATLIGIAIGDGLIKSLDQPLSELLPEHRKVMTPTEARVTLRQLMSMTGGFTDSMSTELYQSMYARDGDFIDFILSRGHLVDPGKVHLYSDVSAHLTVAVLASALKRSGRKASRTVLEYARAKLFGPLGIKTEPAYTGQVAEPLPKAFGRADFGWLTDPDGLSFGGWGLRLTPTDMIKIGELYRADGVWNGAQVLPRRWAQEVSTPSDLDTGYGLLWWIYHAEDGTTAFAASGIYGQRIIVWPSRQAVIVFLTASPPAADRNLNLDPVLVDAIVTNLRN
jgi:CubicO group peptidase (beta-lactamase class C family)